MFYSRLRLVILLDRCFNYSFGSTLLPQLGVQSWSICWTAVSIILVGQLFQSFFWLDFATNGCDPEFYSTIRLGLNCGTAVSIILVGQLFQIILFVGLCYQWL